MKTHDFFREYSNMPLEERLVQHPFQEFGFMRLTEVYGRINDLEDKMSPMRIERDRLLELSKMFLEPTVTS